MPLQQFASTMPCSASWLRGTETILQPASVVALPWGCPWALGAVAEEGGTNWGVQQEDGQGGHLPEPRPHWC